MNRRTFAFGSTIFGAAVLVGCGESQPTQTSYNHSNTAPTLYVPPSEDRIKLSYASTGNQLTTVELKLGPKMCGPAPHVHEDLDEIVRVISGTLTVMVEDEIIDVPAGGWHFRPRKKIHGFWNRSDEPVHFIEIYPNQNFDVMLEKIWALRDEYQRQNLPMDTPEAYAQIDNIQEQWGITMYHERRGEIIKKYGLRG